MKISVCIPTYNGEKYIKEQLDSILSQLHEDDEVIISDDSSTDKTISIIEAYNDKRIKIFENNLYKSPIYNLENALNKATGDYIFLSDQDDIWHPNKVKVFTDELKKQPCIVSDAYVVNGSMEIIHESFFKLNRTRNGKYYNLIHNGYLGCCMAFTKDIKELVLPFPKKIPMHDIWIGNIAAFYSSVKYINMPLLYYRRHGENVSCTTEKSTNKILKRIFYRLYVIVNIYIRLFVNLFNRS